MSLQIQDACAMHLKENTHNVQIQDPMRTNVLLARNNVTSETMAGYLPEELTEMLGVDYVFFCKFDLVNKGVHNYGSEVTTYKDKEKKAYDRNSRKREQKGSEVD